MRCPQCSGYLSYEPEFLEFAARYACIICGWMLSDPRFRKEEPRYFPPDRVDKMIEWQNQYPGYDLYYPRSSESFFRASVKADSAAPVVMGRGRIACNTPALQRWWDGKSHHATGK